MTVLLALLVPRVASPCHTHVTPSIPSRVLCFECSRETKRASAFLGFEKWKTRDRGTPSSSTTLLKWSLKQWLEGLVTRALTSLFRDQGPRWIWTALTWGAWRPTTPELSVRRAELFFTLEYRFSFWEYCTRFSLYKILTTLKGFRKGIILLCFQTVLLVDLTTRTCDWPFSLHDGRCMLSTGSAIGCFPETAAATESKRPSGRWVMQRVKGGISVAQGPNCNPSWRSISSGCC